MASEASEASETSNTIKLKFTIAPLSFYHSYDETEFLDHSNRVLLPKIVLNQLSINDNLHFPLTIDINDTIVGVYEIYEDIDYIYVPDYICKKIDLVEPKQMDMKFLCYDLPKAEFIKLKPHQSTFYSIIDTKGFLENNLKKLYTHLEKGQTINIPHDGNVLYFDVIETKPDNILSINDTDVEVDFEEAHDYVEPPEKKGIVYKFKHGAAEAEETAAFVPFSGIGHRITGEIAGEIAEEIAEEIAGETATIFSTFSGTGRKLGAY
jgi:hypothetical protein